MERKRRSIWASITTSEKVDLLSDKDALLYTWLIPKCDDEGRQQGKPKTVKMRVCPGRVWSVGQVAKMIERIAEQKLIYYYSVKGSTYIQMVAWKEHQTFHGFHPETSDYPPPPPEEFPEYYESTFEVLNHDGCLIEEKRSKEEEKQREVELDTPVSRLYQTWEQAITVTPKPDTLKKLRETLVWLTAEIERNEITDWISPEDIIAIEIRKLSSRLPSQQHAGYLFGTIQGKLRDHLEGKDV